MCVELVSDALRWVKHVCDIIIFIHFYCSCLLKLNASVPLIYYISYISLSPALPLGISGVAFWCFWASSWTFTVKTEIKWSFPPSRTSGAGCWQERKFDFSHRTYKRHPRAQWKTCTSKLYICTDVDLARLSQRICWSMCLSCRPHYHQNWGKDGFSGFDRLSASRTADIIKLQ